MLDSGSVIDAFKHFFVKGEGIDKGFVVLIFLFVIAFAVISNLEQIYQFFGVIIISGFALISYWIYASKKQKSKARKEIIEEYRKGKLSKRSYQEELDELK
jgi:flagellar biosynthesis component FlhA